MPDARFRGQALQQLRDACLEAPPLPTAEEVERLADFVPYEEPAARLGKPWGQVGTYRGCLADAVLIIDEGTEAEQCWKFVFARQQPTFVAMSPLLRIPFHMSDDELDGPSSHTVADEYSPLVFEAGMSCSVSTSQNGDTDINRVTLLLSHVYFYEGKYMRPRFHSVPLEITERLACFSE